MRRALSRTRTTVLSAAVAAGMGAVLLTVPSAEAADRDPAPPTGKCLHIRDTTEVLTWQRTYQPPNQHPEPVLGDGAEWKIDLVDSAGKTVGNIEGLNIGIVKREHDGHIISWEDAKATIHGTTFHTVGTFDMPATFLGKEWIHVTTKGIKGRYKGYTGDWRYKVQKATLPPYMWQAQLEADLCKLDRGPSSN
jgi:hypothetical protein